MYSLKDIISEQEKKRGYRVNRHQLVKYLDYGLDDMNSILDSKSGKSDYDK